jgi:PIN domain nuclease of toxin-antitoxin system
MNSQTTNPEPFYVVDTHALIWYLTGDKKLSPQAKAIFEAAEANETILIIPAIVLAELYYANVKNKWFDDFTKVYEDITEKPYIRFMPLDHTHIPDFLQDSTVPEMHDRIIAGVARRLGAPLISSDPLIQAAEIVTLVW